MNTRHGEVLFFMLMLAAARVISSSGGAANGSVATEDGSSARLQVQRITMNWSQRAKLSAVETMAEYGPPQELTAARLIWHDAGPFERITAYAAGVRHDFPLPHLDTLEHTISYAVPLDKVESVLAFDGSIRIDRTAGELSVRSDSEVHNILALNLAHEISIGKISAAQARSVSSNIAQEEILGDTPPYERRLQFDPEPRVNARISDSPGILGAPVNGDDPDPAARDARRLNGAKGDEAEALAMVMAMDLNQIQAAVVAVDKNLHPEIAKFVRELHEEHGRNYIASMRISEQMGVTLVNTTEVISKRERGASELAVLVPMNADLFEGRFINTVIEAQAAELRVIDDLRGHVRDEALRRHLQRTRRMVIRDRDTAKKLQREIATASLQARLK